MGMVIEMLDIFLVILFGFLGYVMLYELKIGFCGKLKEECV